MDQTCPEEVELEEQFILRLPEVSRHVTLYQTKTVFQTDTG